MGKQYLVDFDEAKEIEVIFDYYNTQIFRINTDNTNQFLEVGKNFDAECLKRVDDQGRIRIIYIADKIPPLSAILQFFSNPFIEVKWGLYAAVIPKDLSIVVKFVPILTYGLGITNMKDKFTARVFDHTHRNDVTEIMQWMDANMEPKAEGNIDLGILKEKVKA